MALRKAVSVLVFTHLYVAVVLGQPGWGVTYSNQSICVLKGSTVELSCTYKYPSGHKVTSTFWLTNPNTFLNLMKDSNYSGRVTYRNDTENNHTLIITDPRESDSATYYFRFLTNNNKYFGNPGVPLNVTDLKGNVTPATVTEGQSVTLTCITSCLLTGNTTYIWYKKNVTSSKASGQSYNITNITSEDRGEYYCEANNTYGRLISSTVSVDVQYGPKNLSVSVSPSGEIVEGSSVTLTCNSDANPPVYNYTWYKKNVTSPKASGRSYSITNITSEDNGEYYCEATNNIGKKTFFFFFLIVSIRQNQNVGTLPVVIGIAVAVLVVIICLFGFIWFRKKAPKSVSDTKDKAANEQGNANPTYGNVSSANVASEVRDPQDDHYSNVQIPRVQETPLYSTAQPQKQEEDVQYSTVNFKPPSSSNKPVTYGVEEEPSVLYSTVNISRT